MTNILHTQVNLFCGIVLLVLYLNSRKTTPYSSGRKYLHLVFILVIATLISDNLAIVLEETTYIWSTAVLYTLNVFYFMSSALTPVFWLMYVCCRTESNILSNKPFLSILWICEGIQFIIFALTPLTDWMFSINQDNIYSRGPLFPIHLTITYLLLLFSAVLALYRRKKMEEPEAKRDCVFLAFFVTLPFAGSFIQLFVPECICTWQCAAISLCIVYVNIQNSMIMADGLTGVHNRGYFNRYLFSRCKPESRSKKLFLIILDVNDFKKINDTYGHPEGDRALRRVAVALKDVFYAPNTFIARYGGDEFAVCIYDTTEERVKKYIESIDTAIKKHNQSGDYPYRLSVSAGYSVCDLSEDVDPEGLMNRADEAMYINKQKYKMRSSIT